MNHKSTFLYTATDAHAQCIDQVITSDPLSKVEIRGAQDTKQRGASRNGTRNMELMRQRSCSINMTS